MKKSKVTDTQILSILKQADGRDPRRRSVP